MISFGKGARAQGPRFSLRLNQPCRRFITNTEDKIMAMKKKKKKKKSK
jgi:hypothetical protein